MKPRSKARRLLACIQLGMETPQRLKHHRRSSRMTFVES
jgi:hypothetical protein